MKQEEIPFTLEEVEEIESFLFIEEKKQKKAKK